MSQVTLAIPSLRDEQIQLRQGGLYWVALDQPSDAQVLALQFLVALSAQHRATLVWCGSNPEDRIGALDDQQGPGQLRVFEVPVPAMRSALESLPSELRRAAVAPGSQVLLMLPATSWQSFDTLQLQQWCERMRHWLRERGCTLLVLCHGQASSLHAELVRLNECLSGLAQLYRHDGGIRYQLHFWHSEQGVCGAQAFELQSLASGFGVVRDEQARPVPTRTDDQRLYLAQRSVLESTSTLSRQWKVFERRIDLLQQASLARAASVLIAIESDQQVEVLSRDLYALRERCGMALKVVVREMEPCLRYRDERLLMSCGANIIVPFGVSLSRFFSLVDSVQGQLWNRGRSGNDLESLLKRLRAPTMRGLLPPREFLSTLDQIYADACGEIEHQLLRLQPPPSLTIEQCLYQVTLRRFGDIATVVEGVCYVFLFACRSDGLESALGNICRLPWRSLFSDCQPLADLGELPRVAFLHALALPHEFRLAPDRTEATPRARSDLNAYTPRQTSPAITDYCE
ncbi:cellulose biosynthesis protein BcsE [Pseudomonas citri]|uniref:cellulose biosynthesis protein BcsE n=1 Tax=Pseudomonas citri TaxID=2978349 RepID=UPI0021B578B1|nr:cellulose biosynthesis protein BcsE [Pseudomonas citri]